MSSRFVSAGAINPTTGEVTAPAPVISSSISPPSVSSETAAATSAVPSASSTSSKPTETTTTSVPAPPSNPDPPALAPSKKSQEWLTVQAELEAARQRSTSSMPSTIGGPQATEQKSLYEVLQANKAAKQAAFEEANKIKNQFRALDDDEIEFLESVAERKRREEEERRREEEGGLAKFRELQRKKSQGEGGEHGEGDGSEEEMGEEELMFLSGVGGGRKRRRGEEKKRLVPGVKRVRSNGEEKKGAEEMKTVTTEPVAVAATPETVTTTPAATATAPAKKPLGGLVSYGSSDEDDD